MLFRSVSQSRYGALTGGVLGGLSSGISAMEHGGDFWTGDGARYCSTTTSLPNGNKSTSDGGPVDPKDIKSFSKKYFKEPKGLGKLNANSEQLSGATIKDGTYTIEDPSKFNGLAKGDKLGGVTIYNHSTRLSDVYFSPANLRSHDLPSIRICSLKEQNRALFDVICNHVGMEYQDF